MKRLTYTQTLGAMVAGAYGLVLLAISAYALAALLVVDASWGERLATLFTYFLGVLIFVGVRRFLFGTLYIEEPEK